MDAEQFREYGKQMVDFIADYLTNIRTRRVNPDVKPNFLRQMIDSEAPQQGEKWEKIYEDIERIIMPGIIHWQSPHMHGFFPAFTSYPSQLGEMLANGLGLLGFTWETSPACTELEAVMMDWLAKMIGLPDDFLHSHNDTTGGGVIQTSASEATLIALLAARQQALRRVQMQFPHLSQAEINGRLVAYCSDQTHSSMEKGCLITLVTLNIIPTDDKLSLDADALRKSIAKDKKKGLIPFCLCASLGTTAACSFDDLVELSSICEKENMWIHVDAAYAGSAFICPEFRYLMNGIEQVHSFAFSPSKWLLVNFDCTALWLRSSDSVGEAFDVDPSYLHHANTGVAIDYRHWQIPLSRRFRSLKLWFTIRSYGVEGLQNHIRHSVEMGNLFESLVKADDRFEVPFERHLGLVVYRLKNHNKWTEQLLKEINSTGKLYCSPAVIKGKYIIRFTITAAATNADDIQRDWSIIQEAATKVLRPRGSLKNADEIKTALST